MVNTYRECVATTIRLLLEIEQVPMVHVRIRMMTVMSMMAAIILIRIIIIMMITT